LTEYERFTFSKGEFVHSNQCRPEEFSEKRLKETEIDRHASFLKHEILRRTTDQVKRMEILEKVSLPPKKTILFAYLTSSELLLSNQGKIS
jgi:hypothetical protein